MAVLQMQRISICALRKNRKQVLELLQRQGVIEVNDIMPEDSVFQKTDVSVAESLFDKNISIAKDALEIIDTYAPEEKSMFASFDGRKIVSTKMYDAFSDKHDDVARTSYRITTLAKKIAENKAEIIKLNTQLDMLASWMKLDIPFNLTGTKHTAVFNGTLPDNWTEEMVYELLAKVTPVSLDIISRTNEQTCIFVLCLKENAESTLEILRGNGFSQIMSMSGKAPAEKKQSIDKKIAVFEQEIESARREIVALSEQKEEIQFLVDYNTMRIEKYDVISHMLQSKNVFVITGYIPQKEEAKIADLLNRQFDCAIEFETPGEEEDIPIALHNNPFSRPLESSVESFSLPGKGEVDPTMVMSLFYYMLFGLMLSDAAYGAIMVIACGVMLCKFKNMEDSMKEFLKMFFFCGLTTVFWGVMFGSYFGDVVDVVSQTFFGHKVSIPAVWFVPVNEPMRMLVFSMLLGVIHLFMGLAMKFYQCARQKQFKDAFYDVILWAVLLISSILVLLSMDIFVGTLGLNFKLSAEIGKISGIFAVLASIGIVLTSGRESKNPFKRFLKGLYGLYGITGYLSDVLSYSRLLALGLATGVICTVINKMGSMAGGGIVGGILFVVVFILGHVLNIGINMLGAYVHATRLQYVEFFGKFYEGGGRKFSPFTINTKYFKFKEKTNNG